MKHRVIFLETIALSDAQLDSICRIKMEAWHYPIEEQKDWIKKNNLPNDIHVLLYEGIELVAYLFATKVTVTWDSNTVTATGIGNVVVDPKHRGEGLGYELLARFQSAVAKSGLALLLCKPGVVGFYQKCKWELYSGEVTCCGQPLTCNCMSINGKELSLAPKIELNRMF